MKANQIHVMSYDPKWLFNSPEELSKVREDMLSMFGETLRIMPSSVVHSVRLRPHERGILNITLLSSGRMMVQDFDVGLQTTIVYSVDKDTIERRIMRSVQPTYIKTWQLYRNKDFRLEWMVTLNTHPRNPLHLNKLATPTRGDQLVKELVNGVDRKGADCRVYELFCHALYSWKVKEEFTKEDSAVIFGTLALLNYVVFGTTENRSEEWKRDKIRELTEKLDVLTLQDQHTLSDTFNDYLKERARDLA